MKSTVTVERRVSNSLFDSIGRQLTVSVIKFKASERSIEVKNYFYKMYDFVVTRNEMPAGKTYKKKVKIHFETLNQLIFLHFVLNVQIV